AVDIADVGGDHKGGVGVDGHAEGVVGVVAPVAVAVQRPQRAARRAGPTVVSLFGANPAGGVGAGELLRRQHRVVGRLDGAGVGGGVEIEGADAGEDDVVVAVGIGAAVEGGVVAGIGDLVPDTADSDEGALGGAGEGAGDRVGQVVADDGEGAAD